MDNQTQPTPTLAKPKESHRSLGILAIIFGGLAILLFFFPILPLLFALAALVLAILAWVKNKNHKRPLALTGLIIAPIALFLALIMSVAYGFVIYKAIPSALTTHQTQTSATWTIENFNALKATNFTTGATGTSYDAIIKQHGKPTTETDTTQSGYTGKICFWNQGNAQISLFFVKPTNSNSYILALKLHTVLATPLAPQPAHQVLLMPVAQLYSFIFSS